VSSRTLGESSSAWSVGIRFSSSRSGNSKSSASGILHRDRTGAQERLDLRAELLARVDVDAVAAEHNLLRREKEVEEQRDAPRVRGADPPERGERVFGRRGGRHADPARVCLGGPDAMAGGGLARRPPRRAGALLRPAPPPPPVRLPPPRPRTLD